MKIKIESLHFAELNLNQKTNAPGSFETYNYLFFSLICIAESMYCIEEILNNNFMEVTKSV